MVIFFSPRNRCNSIREQGLICSSAYLYTLFLSSSGQFTALFLCIRLFHIKQHEQYFLVLKLTFVLQLSHSLSLKYCKWKSIPYIFNILFELPWMFLFLLIDFSEIGKSWKYDSAVFLKDCWRRLHMVFLHLLRVFLSSWDFPWFCFHRTLQFSFTETSQ